MVSRQDTSLWKRLLGFTALGACILIATLYWPSERVYEPIHITLEQLELAESNWLARWGRSPNERDREIILRNATNEEVLFREALHAGLHRIDPVVKRRLWQNMQFLELEQPRPAGMELLERAYDMGMHNSDIVVRRRLVQRLHRELFDAASPEEPTREELEDFINADPETFHSIARLSFVQVYVRGKRGEGPPQRAVELLNALQQGQEPSSLPARLGDPLPMQREFTGATPTDVAKRLGRSFTEAIRSAPPGSWSGPYASSLGWHLVWLHEYRPPAIVLNRSTLEKARKRLINQRKEVMVRKALAELRQRYEIIVDAPVIDDRQQES